MDDARRTPTPRAPSRPVAVIAVLAAVLAPVAGFALYGRNTPALPSIGIVDVELKGGSLSRAQVAALAPLVRSHLRWDLPLILLYGVGLLIGGWLLLAVARSATGRSVARFGLAAACVTVLADLVEDAGLWVAFRGGAHTGSAAFDVAATASVVKFCALVPAALVLAAAVLVTVGRLVASLADGNSVTVEDGDRHAALPVLPDDPGPLGGAAPAFEAAEQARWWRGYSVPECGRRRDGVHDRPTGICLSGGGIRAASVAMGALQSPEFRTQVVPRAQYLVSVSGGGYTSGAFQQALTPAGPVLADEKVVRSAATAFDPGTPEEDHIRRHSSYLASNPIEILVALALVARHLLLSLVLLLTPAVLAGVAAGLFYRYVPIVALGPTAVAAGGAGKGAPPYPDPRPAAVQGLAVLLVLALLAWLVAAAASAYVQHESAARLRAGAGAAARLLAQITLVAAVLVLAVPAVIWVAARLLHSNGGSVPAAGPVGGVVLAYAASIAAVAWKRRKMVTDLASGQKTATSAPRGVVQLILVVLALFVISATWLLLLGSMATVGLRPLTAGSTVTIVVLAGVLVFLGGLCDETTLSLHPFYRTRLALAFAVRRVRRPDGQPVARPYESTERTVLSQYGALAEGTAFPHVVFAASATVGQKRTAPGDHRGSYTFCSDWVGGPDLGYVSAARLEQLAPPRLRRDLTVQGAVALSGAAIAASVGGQRTKWYETLFVVSGLRLGAWMPNPAYVIPACSGPRPWYVPGLPRARRLSYLLRELFGAHSATGPLVQVTDGGFYDNLGLVELFRRGMSRIYCIDASGDTPPAATTLAEALTLAHQELGVQADLEEGTWTTFTAGGGDPLTPADPLALLSARLSQRGVITGTFRYPEGSPFASRGTGVLVVAKASLWPTLSYPVLAYAATSAAFPRDSTGDQFFDDKQYAAYTGLGRALGSAAVAAMNGYDEDGNLIPPPPATPPQPGPPVVIPVQQNGGVQQGAGMA